MIIIHYAVSNVHHSYLVAITVLAAPLLARFAGFGAHGGAGSTRRDDSGRTERHGRTARDGLVG